MTDPSASVIAFPQAQRVAALDELMADHIAFMHRIADAAEPKYPEAADMTRSVFKEQKAAWDDIQDIRQSVAAFNSRYNAIGVSVRIDIATTRYVTRPFRALLKAASACWRQCQHVSRTRT
jgi:hypothetical protein